MLQIKKGFPQEGDIVFCTITKVQYNSVFATLDEFEHKSGMIHISEISPGRIRNIRDYVREGKVVICKVLRINPKRGHIDLSLRRVNENQRRAKVEERKQEGIAENVLKSYAKLHKTTVPQVYDAIKDKLLKEFSSLYFAFEAVVEENVSLADYGLPKKLAQDLEEIIRERIKPKKVSIEAVVTVSSYEPNGVEIVNKLLGEIASSSDLLSIQFLGSGSFKLLITAPDYAVAEKVVDEVKEILEQYASPQTTYEFKRE